MEADESDATGGRSSCGARAGKEGRPPYKGEAAAADGAAGHMAELFGAAGVVSVRRRCGEGGASETGAGGGTADFC